jgi:hypothetical protein
MRRLQYLRPCEYLSIETPSLHSVGSHLGILSDYKQTFNNRTRGRWPTRGWKCGLRWIMVRCNSPTITRTICVRRSLFTLTSFERIASAAAALRGNDPGFRSADTPLRTNFGFNAGPSPPFQTMTEVATVSIVAKNKYSEKAGGLPHPARGGTKVRKPFTRVITPPAIIFASRFALNGSSQRARNHGDGYFHQDR